MHQSIALVIVHRNFIVAVVSNNYINNERLECRNSICFFRLWEKYPDSIISRKLFICQIEFEKANQKSIYCMELNYHLQCPCIRHVKNIKQNKKTLKRISIWVVPLGCNVKKRLAIREVQNSQNFKIHIFLINRLSSKALFNMGKS